METQITDLLTQSVNIALVIVLLAIGYIIKHFAAKINNDLIPPILLILGIIFALLLQIPDGFGSSDIILSTLVTGIASGFTSIGLHQTGKTFISTLSSSSK